ncbi:conserved hypothetical protein [Pyrobaculum islandicum DSM 4184]|uniref:Uncharacterized protein n=1 Tax=Pyrobaculum islandicum (strain DSM 4184 / JCM 9189 / GEO3) TaxID=384616 RepID=A1RQG5_PYRIL|nr:hypothetical protein [Pyrobaculum islandicum]ABL87197.1 conserved hypothetical protein [Pyrobaculum islandicum DSM 4184]
MRKAAYIVLAVLIIGAALYFIHTAPRHGLETISTSQLPTTTTTQTSPAVNTPAVGAVRPSFDIKNYEVNYTVVITVAVGDVSISMRGWSVEGSGALGNYSFGELYATVPPHGPIKLVFKVATEGRVAYIVTCAGGQCQTEVRPANYSTIYLLRGVETSRVEKGPCTYLGYGGVEVEERGRISQEAVAQILGNLAGNGTGVYTTKICEVNGVPLKTAGTAYLNITVYGQRLALTVSIESAAVSAGPFNEDRYRQVLRETKAAQTAKA